MVRTALLALAIVWTLSCSGDDETPKGTFGEQCAGADCAEGLVCQRFPSGNGLCTLPCGTSTATCRDALGDRHVCEGGNCYKQCTDSSHCSGTQQCSNLPGSSQMICTP